jgi:hypothetical protein
LKIITLDNVELTWKPKSNIKETASSLHKKAEVLLREIFPAITFCSEVSIPVKKWKTLYLDLYIPLLQTAIEVHGEQHFKYNKHFFVSKKDFAQYRRNDTIKRDWCEINCIRLIELNFNEDEDEWRRKIRSATG